MSQIPESDDNVHRWSADQCLELIEGSPRAVAVHDKAGWLALFADFAIVEDPVGSRPHLAGLYDAVSGLRGKSALSRFYDCFIAPNTIRFLVERDFVQGLRVVRDLTMEIDMSPSVTVRVPMHLQYQLVEQSGELKVFRLAAHWELRPMLAQQMSLGLAGAVVGNQAFLRMLGTLGLSGLMGFMGAVRCPARKGLAAWSNIRDAIERGKLNALQTDAAGLSLMCPEGKSLDLSALVERGGQWYFGKTLAAGNMLSVSLRWECGGRVFEGGWFMQVSKERQIVEIDALWCAG